jgi:hypothetical protein
MTIYTNQQNFVNELTVENESGGIGTINRPNQESEMPATPEIMKMMSSKSNLAMFGDDSSVFASPPANTMVGTPSKRGAGGGGRGAGAKRGNIVLASLALITRTQF